MLPSILRITVSAFLGMLCLNIYAAANPAGYWISQYDGSNAKQGIVRIVKTSSGTFQGTIFTGWPNPSLTKNQLICRKCSGKLKNRFINCTRIMWGYRARKPFKNKWVDGRILDVFSGTTYFSYIELLNPNTLYVRGHIGFFPLGRSQTWKRISFKQAKRYRRQATEVWRRHILANEKYYRKDIDILRRQWGVKANAVNAMKAARCGN